MMKISVKLFGFNNLDYVKYVIALLRPGCYVFFLIKLTSVYVFGKQLWQNSLDSAWLNVNRIEVNCYAFK